MAHQYKNQERGEILRYFSIANKPPFLPSVTNSVMGGNTITSHHLTLCPVQICTTTH